MIKTHIKLNAKKKSTLIDLPKRCHIVTVLKIKILLRSLVNMYFFTYDIGIPHITYTFWKEIYVWKFLPRRDGTIGWRPSAYTLCYMFSIRTNKQTYISENIFTYTARCWLPSQNLKNINKFYLFIYFSSNIVCFSYKCELGGALHPLLVRHYTADTFDVHRVYYHIEVEWQDP